MGALRQVHRCEKSPRCANLTRQLYVCLECPHRGFDLGPNYHYIVRGTHHDGE